MTATWLDRRTVGLVIALLLGIAVAAAPAGPASGNAVAQTHARSA